MSAVSIGLDIAQSTRFVEFEHNSIDRMSAQHFISLWQLVRLEQRAPPVQLERPAPPARPGPLERQEQPVLRALRDQRARPELSVRRERLGQRASDSPARRAPQAQPAPRDRPA